MEILMIMEKRFEYKNKDSADNLIRYITRMRKNEDRAHELISYGFPYGNAYTKPIEHVIKEFEYLQKIYSVTGSLMCHYVLQFTRATYEKATKNLTLLDLYAQECCKYIFWLGHQVCYAIHISKEDRIHIHFAINTINFITGHKLRQYPTEVKKNIEYPLNELFKKYPWETTELTTLEELEQAI